MQIRVTNVIPFHMDECVEFLPGQQKLLAGEGLKSRALKGHRVDVCEDRNWCPVKEQKIEV